MMSATVYVVAIVKNEDPLDWEIAGVFTSEAKAAAACTEPSDRYVPIPLDQYLGRDTCILPGETWPKAQGGHAE